LLFLRALCALGGQSLSNLPQNQTNKPKQTQMKINTTLATIVAVTLMGSALCHAQEDKKQKQFDKLDADKSGTLTMAEYTSKAKGPEREAAFTARDTDKDGSLTLVEFSTAPAKK
jgi:hypothetical protein